MVLNQVGYRDFHHLVRDSFDTTTWYRLKKDLETEIPPRLRSGWVTAVDEAIEEFTPIQESDLTTRDFDRVVDFGNLVVQDFEKENKQ
jgi:hypothetical protein